MRLKGYAGNILWIDLSKREYRIKPLPEYMAKAYIGGTGFAAYLLWNLVDETTHPLSPENPLIIATGPATGLSLIHI